MVLGLAPFRFVAEEFGRPAVIGGFEPAEILSALCVMISQIAEGKALAVNAYRRAVDDGGSPAARAVMDKVFLPCQARWRGLGLIPASGLELRPEYERFDALRRFGVSFGDPRPIPGCRCGDVLSGLMTPRECPLFGKTCTPQHPTGPCMVSTEGSCAAWYRYQGV